MKASGAAILGAAVVGAGVLLATSAKAAPADSGVDFDIEAEMQLAKNYYANAITAPEQWSNGQLVSLAGLLGDFGFLKESANIEDMRSAVYGDDKPPAEPLPEIFFIPETEIDFIADSLEGDIEQ